jgi:fused signal recognition particle receptor
VAAEITAALSKERLGKDISPDEVKAILAEKIAGMLQTVVDNSPPLEGGARGGVVPQTRNIEVPPTLTLPLKGGGELSVVLVIGVNGNGKTTTIGKLAHQLKAEGKKVMLAAGDTFRAAAVEQLQEWGKRCDIPVVAGAFEADPSSVAFAALERAKAEGVDVLLIDTAGRLHNKTNLMQELQKMIRVMKKLDEGAPHEVIMVLDATTGQNAISQMQVFKEMVNVTGLIVTKLDGTAKGGIIVALARQFSIPILAIGVGEKIDDLQPFDAKRFAQNLVGLE